MVGLLPTYLSCVYFIPFHYYPLPIHITTSIKIIHTTPVSKSYIYVASVRVQGLVLVLGLRFRSREIRVLKVSHHLT